MTVIKKPLRQVGQFRGNGLGLHDMTGNVWEWVQDVYNDKAYSSHSRNNPVNTGGGSIRVCRGGGWSAGASDARCARRGRNDPGERRSGLGVHLLRK